MKRVLIGCGLCCALMMGLFVVNAAQKVPNFSGTWILDQSKSELPQFMQGQSVTWVITQDDKQLARETKLGEAHSGQQSTSGGGRPMMGNMRPTTYNLDGSETTTETPRGKASSKVKLAEGGKVLEVNTVIQGGQFTLTNSERWELSEDGKVLKATQKREGPQGVVESKLVFNKQ